MRPSGVRKTLLGQQSRFRKYKEADHKSAFLVCRLSGEIENDVRQKDFGASNRE
jgi:hypothetical protein